MIVIEQNKLFFTQNPGSSTVVLISAVPRAQSQATKVSNHTNNRRFNFSSLDQLECVQHNNPEDFPPSLAPTFVRWELITIGAVS
jgi:hypothetical protein